MFGFSIKSKSNEIQNLDNKIALAKENLNKLLADIESKKEELGILTGIVEIQDLGIQYEASGLSLSDIEQEKNKVQERLGEMMWRDEIIKTTRDYKVDGSYKKGRKFQEAFCNNLLIGFNSYYEKKKKSITSQNFNKSINLVESKFNKMNKDAEIFGISINSEYLEICIELAKIELDEKLEKAKEKERIKEEKRKLREEQQLLAEAEKERKRLEEERKAMDIAFAKALTDEEREQIKQELSSIDKRIADVDYRVANKNAGYLYVISSPSLPNMVKIGCTRRINPTLRVKELSSSSLPFPFNAHCFVFSDNVFELETNMHKYFDKQRVTPDKEFFYISPKEAIKTLREKFNCDIHFETENNQEDNANDI